MGIEHGEDQRCMINQRGDEINMEGVNMKYEWRTRKDIINYTGTSYVQEAGVVPGLRELRNIIKDKEVMNLT